MTTPEQSIAFGIHMFELHPMKILKASEWLPIARTHARNFLSATTGSFWKMETDGVSPQKFGGSDSPIGAALLLVIGEPVTDDHQNVILQEITKGKRKTNWNITSHNTCVAAGLLSTFGWTEVLWAHNHLTHFHAYVHLYCVELIWQTESVLCNCRF